MNAVITKKRNGMKIESMSIPMFNSSSARFPVTKKSGATKLGWLQSQVKGNDPKEFVNIFWL